MGLYLDQLLVVIVDNGGFMGRLLQPMLAELEMLNVHNFDGPLAALEHIARAPVDLVIVDRFMKPIDGLDFTRMIRRGGNGRNPDMPIILTTSSTEQSSIKAAREAGVDGILVKPFTQPELRRHVLFAMEQGEERAKDSFEI